MGIKITKSGKKYVKGNADDRDNDTLGYSKLPSSKSTRTNSYITPIADVQNEGASGLDRERGGASSRTHLSGPRYNTKTGTFTGRKYNVRPRTQLKHIFRDKTLISQDAEIESMVKKYRPKIVKDVTVKHILCWMETFIDTAEIDEIAEKNSNGAGMEELLYRLQNCKKKGRWQRFVDALSANNYEYDCNLLRGGPKKKGLGGQEKLLLVLAPGIIERINPVEIANHLRSHNGINNFDLEEIKQEEHTRGKRSAASKLLNIIPRGRSANWCQLLCDALIADGQKDLADQFLVRCEDVSSNTEGPPTSSSSEAETTSEPKTLESEKEFRPQLPKRRPKRHSSRQHTKPSKGTYQNSQDAEQVKLRDEVAGLRRELNLSEEKGQVLRELRRKEHNLKTEYGERHDFRMDLSELKRKLTVLEEKKQLMQELTKKENDFKIKFGKDVANTEDNSELLKRLISLQAKILLKEQVETYGEELSHLESGKKDFKKAKKKKNRTSDGDGTYNSFIPMSALISPDELETKIESIVSREVRRRIPPWFSEHNYQGIERDFKLPRPHFSYTSDYYSFST